MVKKKRLKNPLKYEEENLQLKNLAEKIINNKVEYIKEKIKNMNLQLERMPNFAQRISGIEEHIIEENDYKIEIEIK